MSSSWVRRLRSRVTPSALTKGSSRPSSNNALVGRRPSIPQGLVVATEPVNVNVGVMVPMAPCPAHVTKSERQKKPRACNKKRRLARKRRRSQPRTLRSGCARRMAWVRWAGIVKAVVTGSLLMLGGRCERSRWRTQPITRQPQKRFAHACCCPPGLWRGEQAGHVGGEAQQRYRQQRQADAAQQRGCRRRQPEDRGVDVGIHGQAAEPATTGHLGSRCVRSA